MSQCRIEDTAGIVTYHYVGSHQQPLHILIVSHVSHIRECFLVVFLREPQQGVQSDQHRPFPSKLLRQSLFQSMHIKIIYLHVDLSFLSEA